MLWPPGKGLAGIPRVGSFLVNAALADPVGCETRGAGPEHRGGARPRADQPSHPDPTTPIRGIGYHQQACLSLPRSHPDTASGPGRCGHRLVRIGVLRFRRGWRDVERSHAQGRRRRACGVPVSDALHPPRDRFAHGRDLPHRDRRTVCNLLFHHPSTKEPHPLGAHWRQALDEGVKRSKLVCAGRWAG